VTAPCRTLGESEPGASELILTAISDSNATSMLSASAWRFVFESLLQRQSGRPAGNKTRLGKLIAAPNL